MKKIVNVAILLFLLLPISIKGQTNIKSIENDFNNEDTISIGEIYSFPSTLSCKDDNDNNVIIDVSWKCDNFDNNKLGVYTFIPIVSSEYNIPKDIVPTIVLSLEKKETQVSGIKYNIVEKAKTTITNEIEIDDFENRILHLQKYNTSAKTWSNVKDYELDSNRAIIEYPNNWYIEKNSIYRIFIEESESSKEYVSDYINITGLRYFQNSEKYFQLSDKIVLNTTLGKLKKGTMGLRVYYVQKKLKIKKDGRYGPKTIKAVKKFQKKKKIKVTGKVDLTTWIKMGYSKEVWYSLDRYITPVTTKYYYSKEENIEAMINTAYKYLGTKYVVGASGKPGDGIDCSGLVMQSLYSVGINPLPSSIIRHTKYGYEYESRELWKNKKLKKVKYKNRKRGDLVFYYAKGTKTVVHVGIYLGNDQVIEAVPPKVTVRGINYSNKMVVAGIRRPIG